MFKLIGNAFSKPEPPKPPPSPKINPYIENIVLGQKSKNKFAYFFKIEEIQLSFFITLIQTLKIKNFLDIGSNVGFYSLIVPKFTPIENIIAFEPTPLTYEELKFNATNNPSLPIQIKNIGLSNDTGTISFSDFGDMSGKNGIINTSIHNISSAKETIINTDKLDNLFKNKNETYALKIDTEGHELSVLKGGKEFLSNNKCLIQIEMGGYGDDADEIEQYLNSLAYIHLIKLGPDSYFSNIDHLFDTTIQNKLLQTTLNLVIDSRWK